MSNQKLVVNWQGKRKFVGTATNGHTVVMDGPESAGGENSGIRPMEMVLLGLAGCSSFDVVSILEKKKIQLAQCSVTVDSKRADAIPAVYETIHLHFLASGEGLTEKALAQATQLSVDKYCSVAAMLVGSGVQLTYSYEVTN